MFIEKKPVFHFSISILWYQVIIQFSIHSV